MAIDYSMDDVDPFPNDVSHLTHLSLSSDNSSASGPSTECARRRPLIVIAARSLFWLTELVHLSGLLIWLGR